MSALSDYAENKLLDHLMGTTTYTKPTTVYAALFTAAPSDSGGGTEVSGGSYARRPVTFAGASGGAANPTADVVFAIATGNWGTITHFGIFDASTAGNLLMHGALTASKAINTGDQFVVPLADLDVTFA